MANILIVEDDVHIAQGITEYLEPLEHQLDFAYNGKQALRHLDENNYELVLLDLNLPLVDGLEVCHTLSHDGELARIPVIIMTARGENHDVLAGFEMGAWDYLVKPFRLAELVARINVALAKRNVISSVKLDYQGVILDETSLSIGFQGKTIQLHNVGFNIVKTLLQSAPATVKTQLLLQKIWGEEIPSSDPLRAHIYKLRQQFIREFDRPLIATVKGAGYRLDV